MPFHNGAVTAPLRLRYGTQPALHGTWTALDGAWTALHGAKTVPDCARRHYTAPDVTRRHSNCTKTVLDGITRHQMALDGAWTALHGAKTALDGAWCHCWAGALVRLQRCGGKVVSVSAVTLSDPTFPSS